ncbi:hypothetical protein G9A89_002989 [Geosiphon pyriformis]|nr:hypothetical protein G9A89_002989 [Geosiphon pyriformis]
MNLVWKIAMCNVRGINVPAKQENVVYWNKELGNLVSIVMETKLRSSCRLWIKNRFDGVRVFTSGLDAGFLGTEVTIIMNVSLAYHVCKISEVPSWLLSIKLLFKNKLSISILELYASASLAVHFAQAGEINSLIAKAVNKFFFVILSGNFNENESHKCASFKKCSDFGLVNSLSGSLFVRGVSKMIDYMFISSSLANTVVHHGVLDVTVSVSMSLGGLLDMQLNFLHKQANKNCWKFNFKSIDVAMWTRFKDSVTLLANEIFKKKWFKDSGHIFTKEFSKFYRLKLLGADVDNFVSFIKCWCFLNSAKALVIQDLVDFGATFNHVYSALCIIRKSYRALKYAESLRTKKANIRSTIDKRMESFETNKDHTIKSVLERSFRKIVLNHLVVNDKLVLEPGLIKSKVDAIMEGWTWKRRTVPDVSTFSGVMCLIGFDEFFRMVSNLPDGKAAGLLGISNELWKHCNKSVLNMFLVFLNSCLVSEFVPSSWKEAWVSMIPKPYE